MKAKFINGNIEIIDYQFEKSKIDNFYQSELNIHSVADNDINSILQKKDDNRTTEELKKIVVRKQIDDNYSSALKKLDSYKELVIEEYSGKIEDYERLEPIFQEYDDKIKQSYKLVKSSQLIKEKIDNLKKQLISTDYKVIKYYESKITLSEAPYTTEEMNELINQRQSLRNEINTLEEMLK